MITYTVLKGWLKIFRFMNCSRPLKRWEARAERVWPRETKSNQHIVYEHISETHLHKNRFLSRLEAGLANRAQGILTFVFLGGNVGVRHKSSFLRLVISHKINTNQ